LPAAAAGALSCLEQLGQANVMCSDAIAKPFDICFRDRRATKRLALGTA
jgi:hypothetical protein